MCAATRDAIVLLPPVIPAVPLFCRQWLFIVEGIPSVLLGMVTYWLLPSHPLWDAWMLTLQEREMLHLRVGDSSHLTSMAGRVGACYTVRFS